MLLLVPQSSPSHYTQMYSNVNEFQSVNGIKTKDIRLEEYDNGKETIVQGHINGKPVYMRKPHARMTSSSRSSRRRRNKSRARQRVLKTDIASTSARNRTPRRIAKR